MSALVTVKTITTNSVTVPASGFKRLDIDASLSDYVPVCVAGWSGSSHQSYLYIGRFSISDNTLTIILFNRKAEALTDTIDVLVLYARSA